MRTVEKVKYQLEWIGLRGSRWAWVAMISVISLWAGIAYAPGRQAATLHCPSPTPYEQTYTADATAPLTTVSAALLTRLPPPDSRRQRKPPCVKSVGEEAINGYCWLRLGVFPPCAEQEHSYEHNGACYMAVLRAEAPPTSGGGQPPAGVSGSSQ